MTTKKSPPKSVTKMTPPKSQTHRTKYSLPVVVYFTKEQKQAVEKAANANGQGLSAFLRGEGLKAAKLSAA